MMSKATRSIVIYSLLIIASVWSIFPLFWTGVTSIKPKLETFKPTFIPFLQFRPTLSHWVEELVGAGQEYRKTLKNSLLVAATATATAMILGVSAAYALARCTLKLGPIKTHDIITFYFSQILLPPAVIVVPLFAIIRTLHLIDSFVGLAIAHTSLVLPIAVLTSRDIIAEVPRDLEEAALVDGCSRLQAILRITLPLAMPGLLSVALICFAFSWNEFLFALTLTYGRATTIPILVSGAKWGRGIMFWYLSVRCLVAIIPPVTLAIFANRYIIRGLTLGAFK